MSRPPTTPAFAQSVEVLLDEGVTTPGFGVVVQVAPTALFARRGVPRTKPGKIALVLNLVSWVGLGVLVWRELRPAPTR